jgi:hypothetical protein
VENRGAARGLEFKVLGFLTELGRSSVGGGDGRPPVTVNLGTGAFNEVAAFAGGHVNLSATTMQLAVLEAAGTGAVVNATGADLWNQTIQADSEGVVNLDTPR